MTISNGYNAVKETVKLYSDVTANFETLVDYGWGPRYYTVLQLINLCNDEIEIALRKDLSSAVSSTILIPASCSLTWDKFFHKGLIEWRAPANLPTEGKFIVNSY